MREEDVAIVVLATFAMCTKTNIIYYVRLSTPYRNDKSEHVPVILGRVVDI